MLQMTSVSSIWVILLLVFTGGLVVAKLAEWLRIPDVAAFLLFGVLIGPDALDWMGENSDSLFRSFILTLGTVLILFEGGSGVRFTVLREVWLTIVLLSTVGVVVTVLVTSLAAYLILHIPWSTALLLAAVIAATDPATLIPILKKVPVERRVQQTVESESACNDVTASILTLTLFTWVSTPAHMVWWQPLAAFAKSAILGLLPGVVTGYVALWLVSRRGLGLFREFGSVVMMVAAMAAYYAADGMGGSGYMATFAAGVVTGNARVFQLELDAHTTANINHFGNAVTFLLRLMIFVLLGTQVDFGVVGPYVLPGLAVVFVLMFVARPLAVLTAAWPDRLARWRVKEMLFMCWVRETGVIPAALAGMLRSMNVPGAAIISSIVFLAILTTILVEATTTPWVAGKLGLLRPDGPAEDI